MIKKAPKFEIYNFSSSNIDLKVEICFPVDTPLGLSQDLFQLAFNWDPKNYKYITTKPSLIDRTYITFHMYLGNASNENKNFIFDFKLFLNFLEERFENGVFFDVIYNFSIAILNFLKRIPPHEPNSKNTFNGCNRMIEKMIDLKCLDAEKKLLLIAKLNL